MNHHPVIYTADIGSLATIFGTIYGALPSLALILPIIWYSVLLWDRFKK